ncbi:hypothetical protein AvCA_17940 [Azotobacter vinelandii CA]|uniref:Transcriptional regulator SutA RNAP-binding domain-containing protein n=3 Tax=Azotobacter group TaxID=351 RepID=C1DDN6_AZOVD|nr:hypothetical protein [Azotobacter vinelandii]ACO78007.1 hypothetical protein Avin_17940 [Azotobacter vinelandii DJ]AGK16898.1 hypothetical protein AvCA_17940 [Azotobacter vinelandii CA]AGK20165.1 hypothetical protein AvCA6_17940 [Azotobacter vinelandii CA6]WKN23731.1 hypothetical protein AVAEIV_001838 [Azotobacter vinelandii]SFX91634.1 hypothetical protein SAMN04244547_03216 [Azotobacter vinelandii]
MVTRVAGSNGKAKPDPSRETHESLDALISAFLRSGGEIQQIANGVSGQVAGPPSRHIKLGKK